MEDGNRMDLQDSEAPHEPLVAVAITMRNSRSKFRMDIGKYVLRQKTLRELFEVEGTFVTKAACCRRESAPMGFFHML